MTLDFTVVAENAGLFARGTMYTVIVAASTMALSLLFAAPLAVLRDSGRAAIARTVAAYSWIARATPALTVLFFAYYGLPTLGIYFEPITAAVVGLTLVSTGYNLEIIRAGLRAVPAGQNDAARALGLSTWHRFRRIVFPQAMRIAVPPLVSNLTLMLKGSALASLVAVSELTGEATGLISLTYRSIEILCAVAAIYLALNGLLILAQWGLERKLRLVTR